MDLTPTFNSKVSDVADLLRLLLFPPVTFLSIKDDS